MTANIKDLQHQRDESISIARQHYYPNGQPNLDYFEHRNCPVCNESKSSVICRNDSLNVFVCCNNCQMVYMNPVLKKELINEQYTDSKNKTAKHKLWNNSLKHLEPVSSPRKSERFDLLLKYSKRGRFLDFGCGFGKLTDQLKFFFDEIEGVEIDPFCAKHAGDIFGFKIYNDFIENLNLNNRYDACMSYNNIEHLRDPEEILKHIYASLKDKGILYIECPNMEGLSIKIFKGKHHLLQSTEHLNMFNLTTLSRLLKNCGFKPIEIKTRKLDILCNDLIMFFARKEKFYHRCSSPLFDNGIYKSIVNMTDKIAQRVFPMLNNRLFVQGAYIQIVARKTQQ